MLIPSQPVGSSTAVVEWFVSGRGANCDRLSIADIGKLLERPPGVVISDVIEGAVDRMLDHVDNGAGSSGKTTQCNRLVVGVKSQGLDQPLTPIGKIISVLIGRRKVRARVPGAPNSAVSCKGRSRHRRARISHVSYLRVA